MVLDMWSTSSKYSIFILNTLEPKYTVLVLHLHVHCLKQTDEMQGLVQFLVHINMCIHPLPCLLQQITHLLAWKTKIKEAFSKRKKYQKMLVLFFFLPDIFLSIYFTMLDVSSLSQYYIISEKTN